MAWSWWKNDGGSLVVVNLSDKTSQARVQVPGFGVDGKTWRLIDLLSGVTYDRNGDEMVSPGLYVELEPWQFHLFRYCPV